MAKIQYNINDMEAISTKAKNIKEKIYANRLKVKSIRLPADCDAGSDIMAASQALELAESEMDHIGTWMDQQKNSLLSAEANNNSLIYEVFRTDALLFNRFQFQYQPTVRGILEKKVAEARSNINNQITQIRQENIMNGCKDVTTTFMNRKAHYSLDNGLIYGDIVKCYNEANYACCASYTTMALYRAGELTPEQINPRGKKGLYNYQYTGDTGIPDMLAAAGWEKVKPSEVQKGDVVNNFGEHVLIYAGDGQYWDNTSALVSSKGVPPTGTTRTYDKLNQCQVWRMPDKTMDDLTEAEWKAIEPYLDEVDLYWVSFAEDEKK